ncbi:MAG: HAMP domain-containing histidine kinase [Candidatus Aureabacteria bacterium]|nr:HAMP domain-containing histidine kinase [Candidatus Auribacterota bacterium]
MSGITTNTKTPGILEELMESRYFLHYYHLGKVCHELLHEIKNKLIAPSTFIQTFHKNEKNEKFRTHFASLAASELDIILHRINQMLSYSRRENKTEKTHDFRQPFEQTVRDSLVLLDWELKKNKISVETDIPEGILFPLKNQLLKDVVINLLINAIHALKSKKFGTRLLRIVIFRNEKETGFRIMDTGIGMSRKELSKIFLPFYTTKESGSGIGLCVVKKYLEENNGSIRVSSKKNMGSCFEVYFKKKDFFNEDTQSQE